MEICNWTSYPTNWRTVIPSRSSCGSALTLCFKQTRTLYCRTLGDVLRDTVHLPTEFVRNEKYECVFEADARPRRCPPPRVLISRATGGEYNCKGGAGRTAHFTGTTV